MNAPSQNERQPRPFRTRLGFTMVEVIVAVGIVATVALAILALLTSAGDTAAEIKASSAARRASGIVRQWVKDADFDSLFTEIRSGREILLVNYSYRGGDSDRADGSPEPEPDFDGESSIRFIPIVRRFDDTEIAADLEAVDGPVFLCRLTLLSLVDKNAPDLPEVADFDLASLPLRIEMFRVPSVAAVVQKGVPNRRPIFSFQTHAFR